MAMSPEERREYQKKYRREHREHIRELARKRNQRKAEERRLQREAEKNVKKERIYLLLDGECNVVRTITPSQLAKEKKITEKKARSLLREARLDGYLVAAYE